MPPRRDDRRPGPRRGPCSDRAGAPLLLALASVGSCGGGAQSGGEAQAGAEPASDAAWFADVAREKGIGFAVHPGSAGEHWMPEIMCGGAALFDCEEDGDLDVLLVDCAPLADPGAATNRLFLQVDRGRFADGTGAAGLGGGGQGMGAAIGDLDGDGLPEVYLTYLGPDRLLRNRGEARFEEVTSRAGIDVDGWSTSAACFDPDRDGDLDVYVARYVAFDASHPCFDAAGRPDFCGPKEFPPLPDVLLRNDGQGGFADVSAAAGIATVSAAGLGVACDDFDDDGWIDVYVANDAYANQLWTNQGDGRFREEALARGCALNMNGQPEAGMGVVAADLNGDLRIDIFVTHLKQETNTLYLAKPDGSFGDASGTSGLGAPSMPFTAFGVAAEDFDLDGDPDVAIAHGAVFNQAPRSGVTLPPPWNAYAEPDHLYENLGGGTFRLLEGGLGTGVEIGRALVAGDVDQDGDLDLLVAGIEGPARLLENRAPRGGHWLSVRCLEAPPGRGHGVDARRDALGARVTVEAGGVRRARTVRTEAGYLAASAPLVHFGLGDAAEVAAIEVRWPDGSVERFPGGPADRRVELVRGTGEG